MLFATHASLQRASLRRTHHRTSTSVVRTIGVANSKSEFPSFGKCTTDGAAIAVPPHNDNSDSSSAQ